MLSRRNRFASAKALSVGSVRKKPARQALGMVNWAPLALRLRSSDPGDR